MNALALNSLDSRPAARGSALGVYVTETRYELTRMIRNPGIAIPVLILPLALYGLFALVIAGEAIDKDPNVGIFLFSAFSIMAVTMQALFGTGVTLALERDMGLLRLKRAQPAPPAAWVVAKIASGFVLGILAYAPIVIVALATGKLALSIGQVAAFSGALLVGIIPFCAMGLMVGSLASGSAAPDCAPGTRRTPAPSARDSSGRAPTSPTWSSIQRSSVSRDSAVYPLPPRTPNPPARETAATTSRQWLKAKSGNSTPTSSVMVSMRLSSGR